MKQLWKISGFAYIMIFIGGFYANFAILEELVDFNNSIETTSNIIDNHNQFGKGLLGFLIMLIFDFLLVFTLFDLTKKTQKILSYWASFFRLLHALFFAFSLSKIWLIFQQTSQANTTNNLQQEVMKYLIEFDFLWTLGLLFFAVHLTILSIISLKVKFIPNYLGVLLALAAFGYFIDGLAKLTFNNYQDYQFYFETLVILTGVLGELSFTFWLLIKSLKKTSLNIQTI